MATHSNLEGARLANNLICEKNRFLINVQALGAAFTIDDDHPSVLFLDPGGSDRTVLLPTASASLKGLWYDIVNSADADGEELNVKSTTAGGATLGLVATGEIARFICDGTTWYAQTASDIDVAQINNLTVETQAALGTSITSLVGFYGTTPKAQQASSSQAAVNTTAIPALTVVGGLTGYGYSSTANFDVAKNALNSVIARVAEIEVLINEMRRVNTTLGILKGSA